MEHDRQSVHVKFNFGSDWERFVPEVPQTARQLLCRAVFLVVIVLRTVVDHGHDVGIVVLVIVVEGIEKHTQTIPTIRRAEDRAFEALSGSVPKGQPVSSYSTSTSDSKLELNLPPVKIGCGQATPDHALLAPE